MFLKQMSSEAKHMAPLQPYVVIFLLLPMLWHVVLDYPATQQPSSRNPGSNILPGVIS